MTRSPHYSVRVPRSAALRSGYGRGLEGRGWYRGLSDSRRRHVGRIYGRYRNRNYFRLWDLPFYYTFPVLPMIEDYYWDDENQSIDLMMDRFRYEYPDMYAQGYVVVPDYERRRFVWTTDNSGLVRGYEGGGPPPFLY